LTAEISPLNLQNGEKKFGFIYSSLPDFMLVTTARRRWG
jgi:hypothetical protein